MASNNHRRTPLTLYVINYYRINKSLVTVAPIALLPLLYQTTDQRQRIGLMLLMISTSDFSKKIYDKLNSMSYITEKEKTIDI